MNAIEIGGCMSLKELTHPLLAWYRENARDLPWRHTDDPYRIWVSEIMLQQTRVAAVLGYYDRFLKELPDVQSLANASEDRLLKLWEGLGYYSRVRNMQKAAVQIIETFDGSFPETYDELLSLSGIGEYTAGAIASAAFGVRVPAVDGNVLRVISRITENDGDIADPKVKKGFREELFSMLPESADDMRIFNQAMMELGATVCVPNGVPKCDECPLRANCKAFINHTTDLYPVKSAKKGRRIEKKSVFVLICDGKIALRKRDESGLLAGLWEFPNAPAMDDTEVYAYLKNRGISVIEWKKQLTAKHIFTHVEWHMTGYVLQVTSDDIDNYVWADKALFTELALPSAFARFTQEAKELLGMNENS